MALRLLASEIDVLLWKWPPFCKMAFIMSYIVVWYIWQYFFWNLRLTKPIYRVKVEGSAPPSFWDRGNSMTSRSDISLKIWFCLLFIQITNIVCEGWTYGIVAHTFDIRLKLKLFKFTVNYFFEEFICETSRSDSVFSHKWASRYTNLNFSSFNMHKWN